MPRNAVAICCDENILAPSESAVSKAGYDLIRIPQAESILNTLPSLQPELIILDLDLPGRGAAEILHWIATQRPRPALVLVSSGESLGLLREGFVVPDFQLLIKPLGQNEINEAVTRASRQGRTISWLGNESR